MDWILEVGDDDHGKCNGDDYVGPGNKDTWYQFIISVSLGISAFLSFCALRPRWKSLYASRKRASMADPSIALPQLPDTFFGWMGALYRVTEQQVLASAGLDAFVFLNFFKMAMKLFAIVFFFALAVLEPINRAFPDDLNTSEVPATETFRQYTSPYGHTTLYEDDPDQPDDSFKKNKRYLWSYLVFTYFFTGLTLFFMNRETFKVLRVRQDYLGTQSTITDRTFRLAGIPKDLRTEEDIKNLVERLEIGKVKSVTLCRKWKKLDDLMDQRQSILAKLEETWTAYLGQKPVQLARGPPPPNPAPNGDIENSPLIPDLEDEEAGDTGRLLSNGNTTSDLMSSQRPRPQTRFWYGFLHLQSRKTDAIDYYTEKLRVLDDKIRAARKKDFEPTDLAFVTMDSIAACQMAIQALIDPHPGQLLTKPAPAPSDIDWRNTYASHLTRRVRSVAVTLFVCFLTVVWLVPVAFMASFLSICTIEHYLPRFAGWLKQYDLARALVQTGLPTAVVSLLNVAVPYLYDYLSFQQGMLSRGDAALSVISKNFFFTFFNIFLIFTVFGAVTSIIDVLRESLKDTTYIAYALAGKIVDLGVFYTNFIMLQGIGLFPFRLLQFGSVSLYPINRMGAKTPRDFAQIVRPPMFYYGFYLPTALLVFILCLVYSTLPQGYKVVGLGVAYFTLGYFTYKYQLLYAMEQPQHATGGAWNMICYRIMLGLLVFQLTMSGYLALRKAFTVALLISPLLFITVWYGYSFRRHFEPLTKFISLRSIKRGEDEGGNAILDEDLDGEGEETRERIRRGSTVDEDKEKGARFVNPNLVKPLEQPWIYKDSPPLPSPSSGLSGLLEDRYTDEESDLFSGSRRRSTRNANGLRVETSRGSSQSRADTAGGTYADLLGGDMYSGERTPRGAPADTPRSNGSSSAASLGDTHIWRDGV
ncbi:hypothetical protein SMACR_01470 [Sordaria macrospora]|uniref:WGS project CABT00000000 data, contig 2.4 n=2 Tax=Sordaria macrospora TaxID=5147 RepID=F7VQX3_SORMK|nr:uncharacterized protein SMAC_01470 [Sordaria macrospora k-hell]KAA8632215.1 hypothetical protein SMACR_01470 [Sordaria macrospora]KAH7634567.1 hypothetical protein B0T09DRAFT_8209 [Sordaria sp. MPI-SDFR-AT-0083]WPJ58647.1 hypothetical protein SMAC4_01470 [Sordaria macrospora]CCC07906.1 unnamed protein product [Sordaria macrospora k-hell]